MLQLRQITDTEPRVRMNNSIEARLLAFTPKDPTKLRSPSKITISQNDACMQIALWGYDAAAEATLRAGVGKIFHFTGVDLQKQPESCSVTHPFSGNMSRTIRTGTTHFGNFAVLADDHPTYLRREFKFQDVINQVPYLDIGAVPVAQPSSGKTCHNGCRQAMIEAFPLCIYTGKPHIDPNDVDVTSTADTTADDIATPACPDCGRVPGPTNIWCPVKTELVVHPGCEAFAAELEE